MKYHLILILAIFVVKSKLEENKGTTEQWAFVGNPLLFFHPCKGNEDISGSFEPGLAPGEENQYKLFIAKKVPKYTNIKIKFDSPAVLTLTNHSNARITALTDVFNIRFFNNGPVPSIIVKGPSNGAIPYITSININTHEYCTETNIGVLDSYITGYQDTAALSLSVPDDTCGRRKVEHTELIVNGLDTKSGDWPWHVALYRLEITNIKYICGGTLISKNFVLTAAHCTTIRGSPVLPEILSVVLGKYNLIGGDIGAQEKEVHKIIVHENYDSKNLDNDISLLKLKTEVVYDDYIQPACIWHSDAYKKLPSQEIYGTVVGWGFDQTEQLANQLRKATMPKISESSCLKSNPTFFGRVLNGNKFCAGYRNGTSACNGDSGGGFVVFVPDVSGNASPNASGTWHIRGIVSVGISRTDKKLCDPNNYVLFTDVSKYHHWLDQKMK